MNPNRNAKRTRWCMRVLESVALLAGGSCLLAAGFAWADGAFHSQASISAFEASLRSPRLPAGQSHGPENRRGAFGSAERPDSVVMAVLRIPSVGLEAPIFASTDTIALNRGAGWVSGTAVPGKVGNSAIAGHRDTFFRGLKDIAIGALIELTTPAGKQGYQVIETTVVDPLDVSVLEPTEEHRLTLITCYPFYYAGSAPDRFIVRAERVPAERLPTFIKPEES